MPPDGLAAHHTLVAKKPRASRVAKIESQISSGPIIELAARIKAIVDRENFLDEKRVDRTMTEADESEETELFETRLALTEQIVLASPGNETEALIILMHAVERLNYGAAMEDFEVVRVCDRSIRRSLAFLSQEMKIDLVPFGSEDFLPSHLMRNPVEKSPVQSPVTTDTTLVCLCRDAGFTADKLNAALDGLHVHKRETPEQSVERLNSALGHLLDEVTLTPATSAEGLRAKAEAAKRHSDEAIAWSIVADLLERDAVPSTPVALTKNPLANEEELFDRYNEWLFLERRMLMIERYGLKDSEQAERFVPCSSHPMHFSSAGGGWEDRPKPMSRAVAVMGVAGAFLGPDNHLSPAQIARRNAASGSRVSSGVPA